MAQDYVGGFLNDQTVDQGYGYTYDPVTDSYVINTPDGSSRYTGEIVRKMVRAYVEDGENQTMHQVAVRFGISRKEFFRLKTAIGITKQHEPFTPEELADRPFEDLVGESLAAKRSRLARRAESVDWGRTKLAASKWLALEKGVLDPVLEYLNGTSKAPRRAAVPTPRGSQGLLLHVHGSDLHYGALAASVYGGPKYSRKIARERYLRGLAESVALAKRVGDLQWILNPAGGDFFHMDNTHGRTTSMNHAMDLDGIPEEVFTGGVDLFLEGVEYLLANTEAQIEIPVVPGNHDYMLSVALGVVVQKRYEDNSRVAVTNLVAPYAFKEFGDCAILMHHGHGTHKPADLAALLTAWCKERRIAPSNGYAVTGNLHHLETEEDSGIVLLQQPSPAESDRWHHLNGYSTARPAMAAYLFDPKQGLIIQQSINFDCDG